MGKAASKLKKRRNYHNLKLPRFGSLMSIKDRPLPKTPTEQPASQYSAVPSNRPLSPTWTATTAKPATITTPLASPKLLEKQPGGPHMSIEQWLRALDLYEQYNSVFSQFNGVEDLLHYEEADIKDLGVRNSAHRARIVSSLNALRDKYNKNRNLKNLRYSVALDNGKHVRKIQNSEDLKVVTEFAQSKSLCNLIMEPMADPGVDAATMRKALEWELSLDARDLRSHAWYHGAIPRHRAEEIVQQEGEFLVRDCTSQPGNYVLTCRTKVIPLHFVINKVVIQPDTVYERVQYSFEDDMFDTVPDLITFYVGSGKPISIASGARIQHPCNRMYPLSFYATKYPSSGAGGGGGGPSPGYSSSGTGCTRIVSPVTAPSPPFRYATQCRPSGSPTRFGRDAPPRLPNKKHRSQSLTPSEVNKSYHEKCNSADGVIQPLMTRSADALKFSTHSLPRNACNKMSLSPSVIVIGRGGGGGANKCISGTSDPSLSPCAERRHFGEELEEAESPPPPKPSRIPSLLRQDMDGTDRTDSSGFIPHGCLQRVASYHASGSDSGNGSGDSAQSSAAGDPIESNHKTTGVVIKNPRYIINSESTITLKNIDFDYVEAETKLMQLPQPELNFRTKFDLENFTTLLLPSIENRPLDVDALRSIRMTLQENAPRIIANHLTRVDLDLVLGGEQNKSYEEKLSSISGVELCGLPVGHQLRMDLIERTECLKLLIAVTILTCTNDYERAETLNKWIEIAIDTKTALGNLYGFCGIMLGLCLPQVQQLTSTWHMLRQKWTDSAFNFEAKLRPMLKSMNECSNPQAPNTTIPHLIPFVLLQERTLEEFIGSIDQQQQQPQNGLGSSCLHSWESHDQDFGLTTLLAHLDASRKFADMIPTYRRNAEIVLSDCTRTEELILDTFRTEFHMKFLWGSRGALTPSAERHEKFERVLNAMVEKYCGLDVEGTPV